MLCHCHRINWVVARARAADVSRTDRVGCSRRRRSCRCCCCCCPVSFATRRSTSSSVAVSDSQSVSLSVWATVRAEAREREKEESWEMDTEWAHTTDSDFLIIFTLTEMMHWTVGWTWERLHTVKSFSFSFCRLLSGHRGQRAHTHCGGYRCCCCRCRPNMCVGSMN